MKKINVEEIAERLNRIKEERKLNTAILAEYGKTTFQTMSQLLKGKVAKPNIVILQNISEQLKVNVEWLIYGSSEVSNFSEQLNLPENGYFLLYTQAQERIEEQKDTIENLKYTIQLQRTLLNKGVKVGQNFHNDIELPPYEIINEGFIRVEFGMFSQNSSDKQEVA